jgi:hypothetical protein
MCRDHVTQVQTPIINVSGVSGTFLTLNGAPTRPTGT